MLNGSPENFKVMYNRQLEAAELTWENGNDSYSFRQGYLRLADLMQHHRLRSALIDVSRRGHPSHADQLWLFRQFLPSILPAIEETIRLAYVLTPEEHQVLQTQSPNGITENYSQLLKIHAFCDDQLAREWLLNTNIPVRQA
jgi:hypothetical protein